MAQNNLNKSGDDFIHIQDLFYLFLNKWYWFVIAVIVALSVAFLYLAKTPPVYTRSASILIKDNSKSGNTTNAETSAFADLGIFTSNTNIINELHTFQSPSLMIEVVRRLKLDYSYGANEGLRELELYNRTPCTVNFSDINENQSLAFIIELLPDKRYRLTELVSNMKYSICNL